MQAVILAGGLGTRLQPITRTVPKPMVPVAGAPYLEHQIRLLRRFSIRDIVVLNGYLGEQIEQYFGCGDRLDVAIRYSREPEPLGTGGGLRLAAPLLADCFLLIYGDSYLPIDYREVLQSLTSTAVTGVLVVYDNSLGDTSVRNNVAVDEHGCVIRYDKDSQVQAGLRYVDAGVLAFRRSVVDLVPAGRVVSLEKEVFPYLIARRDLRAHITAQRFYDIGTPERLKIIEGLFTHDHHTDAIPG